MQVLNHKAKVNLTIDPVSEGIRINHTASLLLNPDETVSVFVEKPLRLPFRAGATKRIMIGTLENQAATQLKPALQGSGHLRVRVVEVEPPHVTRTGIAAVFISVWGSGIDVVRPRHKTGIFTRSIINNHVSTTDNS